ncbi:ANTAR domain-containing response regulator [Oceanomicrobium pacificus]|uniref:ANTAR domain-containing protein n=1 Tax=Oceanomicrobium pacificus TaxID=2692916 RepID=A0A6B0TRR1_9RHOB|nr:ANTAR domain-containing protein [Oceanomicrobium pacificus]MXU63892.1 ANTAR domain-containing protein [Oceanomicrobium pacificus]
MSDLHIAVIDQNPERAEMILDALGAMGSVRVSLIGDMTGIVRRLADLAPDIVLVDLEHPSRDVLSALTLASGPTERPVAMFVDRSDKEMMRAAIESGVSAYVVDGLRKDRVRPVLEAAMARFDSFAKLRSELATTRAALEDRKTIDRAKGLLMAARGLNEDEAYALLRKTAMDRGKKVVEVAEGLVTAAGLLS